MMKKLHLIFSFLCLILLTVSCKSDDTNASNEAYAKKWYISDQKTTTTGNGDSCENSYYKLKSNGTIEYRYMASSYYCEHDTEMGTWSIQGNTLTRHFPSDPGTENEITMKDEVISVSATELKLKNLDNGRTNTLYNFD